MAHYRGRVKVDVSSPEAFVRATDGNSYDIDGYYMAQCLTAGHMVAMADGTYKDIADLKVGDMVFNHNLTEVNEVLQNVTKEDFVGMVELASGVFITTADHKFYGQNGEVSVDNVVRESVSVASLIDKDINITKLDGKLYSKDKAYLLRLQRHLNSLGQITHLSKHSNNYSLSSGYSETMAYRPFKRKDTVHVLSVSGDHTYNADNVGQKNCWDLWALFNWSAYSQGTPTRPGGGGAKHCWTVSRNWYANNGYQLITSASELRDGDWVIWGYGDWGHVGMYWKGKIWGQNQTAQGASANVSHVSIAMNSFLGAFRPNIWLNHQSAPSPKPQAKNIPAPIKRVAVPVGVSLVTLATALGLTVPQILQQDSGLKDIKPEQKLDSDQAKKAAEAAQKALEQNKKKTPIDIAKEKCGDKDKCVEFTIEKWDGGSSNGTISTICHNNSSLALEDCVKKTIDDNKELITIAASKRNVSDYSGHWIFPGEKLVIKK